MQAAPYFRLETKLHIRAGPKNSSPVRLIPQQSSLANTLLNNRPLTLTFTVNSIHRNFRMSPMSIQWLMHGSSTCTRCSIASGGIFSPPAVIISSATTKGYLESHIVPCVSIFHIISIPLSVLGLNTVRK